MDKNLWLVIGYAVFILYTVGIVMVGAFLEKKLGVDKTLCRKITHIISAVIWLICYCFFGFSIHWLILNGISALLLGVSIFSGKMDAFAREDGQKSVGLFYFALSTLITAIISFSIGEETYLYTGIAYFCLALGDGFAPIVARIFKKHNPKILPTKSLLGTLSVFAFSFLSTFVFSQVFQMELSILFMLSITSLTCLAELYGFWGLDNIFIELSVFGYLLMYHFGLVGVPLQVVIVASPLLAILALGSHAMTADAGACAFLLFAFVGFFGGDSYVPVIFISILFAISTAVSVVGKRIKRKGLGVPEHAHASRRAKQIVAVGLFAVIALGVYRYTDISLFRYLFYLSLAEQFADSMASDIGSLTKRKNVNIVTFKPCEKGISGGVSLLGTISAVAGSFLLLLVPLALEEVSLKIYLWVGALAFVGTVVDSLVGALFQSLYRCTECGASIEHSVHCGKPASLIKGLKIVDNTTVNYIAGFFTCVFGIVLLWV